MAASDLQLNAAIRSLFASHWIDLQSIRFAAFRGTVRVYGELCYLGEHSENRSEPSQVENLEQEIRRLRDVRRVYFHLKNWRKNNNGEWECLDRAVTQARLEGFESAAKEIHTIERDKTQTETIADGQ